MIYDQLSNLKGNGQISNGYMPAGKNCYEAHNKALGLYDEAPWDLLVWREQ